MIVAAVISQAPDRFPLQSFTSLNVRGFWGDGSAGIQQSNRSRGYAPSLRFIWTVALSAGRLWSTPGACLDPGYLVRTITTLKIPSRTEVSLSSGIRCT